MREGVFPCGGCVLATSLRRSGKSLTKYNIFSAEATDTRATSRGEGAGIRSMHSSEHDGSSRSLHDVTSTPSIGSMTPENSLRQTLSALPSVRVIAQTKQALTEKQLSREGLLHEQACVQRKIISEFDSASLCSSFDAMSEAAFNKCVFVFLFPPLSVFLSFSVTVFYSAPPHANLRVCMMLVFLRRPAI